MLLKYNHNCHVWKLPNVLLTQTEQAQMLKWIRINSAHGNTCCSRLFSTSTKTTRLFFPCPLVKDKLSSFMVCDEFPCLNWIKIIFCWPLHLKLFSMLFSSTQNCESFWSFKYLLIFSQTFYNKTNIFTSLNKDDKVCKYYKILPRSFFSMPSWLSWKFRLIISMKHSFNKQH